jgi:hypothetical protein
LCTGVTQPAAATIASAKTARAPAARTSAPTAAFRREEH